MTYSGEPIILCLVYIKILQNIGTDIGELLAILSRYPMDQSEISQNIRTSEMISFYECEYFRYLRMDHAISVLSYGLVTCSSFCFARKAQTLDSFGWYIQLDFENSRLCNETTTYPLLTILIHTKHDSSFLSFTRNFSILCQHCWYSALNTAKYPMANSIVLWSNQCAAPISDFGDRWLWLNGWIEEFG